MKYRRAAAHAAERQSARTARIEIKPGKKGKQWITVAVRKDRED